MTNETFMVCNRTRLAEICKKIGAPKTRKERIATEREKETISVKYSPTAGFVERLQYNKLSQYFNNHFKSFFSIDRRNEITNLFANFPCTKGGRFFEGKLNCGEEI